MYANKFFLHDISAPLHNIYDLLACPLTFVFIWASTNGFPNTSLWMWNTEVQEIEILHCLTFFISSEEGHYEGGKKGCFHVLTEKYVSSYRKNQVEWEKYISESIVHFILSAFSCNGYFCRSNMKIFNMQGSWKPLSRGVGRLGEDKALEGQAIVCGQCLAPPMLCLLRTFQHLWPWFQSSKQFIETLLPDLFYKFAFNEFSNFHGNGRSISKLKSTTSNHHLDTLSGNERKQFLEMRENNST